VAVVHASNVTGAIQPVRDICRIAREHEVFSLIDAAQSLGHLPIDVAQLGCDFLAAPGHKGLLGPLGTGLLYLRRGTEQHVESTLQGGTGTNSDDLAQPAQLPGKFEAGNLNVPALAGLLAGIEHLERELPAIHRREQELSARLRAGLAEIAGVTLYGPSRPSECVGVASITLAGFDPQELAALLDAHYGLAVRAGLHCAPLLHRRLGTIQGGGTVRFSLGPFTTEREIDRAIEAIGEVAS
jgi:selenocysteine lyase/cysteine desulfurase